VHQHARCDRQIGTAGRRAQIGDGSAAPPATDLGRIHSPETHWLGAVQIVGDGMAGAGCGVEKSVEDRRLKPAGLDMQRPAIAAIETGTAITGLGFAEIGQAMGERPV